MKRRNEMIEKLRRLNWDPLNKVFLEGDAIYRKVSQCSFIF
jgi:hypothetical protein